MWVDDEDNDNEIFWQLLTIDQALCFKNEI